MNFRKAQMSDFTSSLNDGMFPVMTGDFPLLGFHT